MLRTSYPIILLVVLATAGAIVCFPGCKKDPGTEPEVAQQESEDAWLVELDRRLEQDLPGLVLPRSTATLTPEPLVNVFVSSNMVMVDGVKVVDVVDGKTIPDEHLHGTLITPLFDTLIGIADELKAKEKKPPYNGFTGRILITCDRGIPFSLLRSVMYTFGQATFGWIHFLVINNETEQLALVVQQPVRIDDWGAPEQESYTLSVSINNDGFFVQGRTGSRGVWIGSASDTSSEAGKSDVDAALPLDAAGNYDFAALTALAIKAKPKHPGDHMVFIIANEEIPYETIIHTIDALREYQPPGSDTGQSLFPRFILAG